MQGQQGSVSSLSEALNFEHGSTSSGAVIDQQMRWNDINDLAENGLQDFMNSVHGTDITYMNSICHDEPDFNRWSLGEASSSGTKNEVNQDIPSSSGVIPALEERESDGADLNLMSLQCSEPHTVHPIINLNEDFTCNGEDASTQVLEHPDLYKSSGSEYQRDSPPRDYAEGRRASCKRKTIESSVGQSSSSAGYADFQLGESSTWAAHPSCYNPVNGLSISDLPEQSITMQGPRIPDFPVPGVAESSHRNFRVRFNPSNQQEAINPAMFPAASVVRRPGLQQSSRLPLSHHPLNTRLRPALDHLGSQSQNILSHVRTFPNSLQPILWSGNSTSRIGHTSSSSMPVDRGVVVPEEIGPRSSGNMPENPLLLPSPELRNLVPNPVIRTSNGENAAIPRNTASTSRVGSSTGVQPSPNLNWVPPPHYPRRLSELVRRSLLSSLATEPSNLRDDHSMVRPASPASPEEAVLSSGTGGLGRHQTQRRTASWVDRQGDSTVGIPHSLRVLAAASRGRSRLIASEIRNVLDFVRRGENLRFEDIMLLDHSAVFGVADIHDRYRDMRLDVDNMSYEELLALEERIGDVCTGLSEETILKLLKQRKHSVIDEAWSEPEPCCVCQEEYSDGEDLGMLECGHDFHTECIKQWLKQKNICPICKTTGLNTSE